ncbi:MAG: hypothetical protein LBN27_12315 [Prevotellaceae bacterium]|jgi:hypothetical protein|nr:hypothetical protein [Prevotellaceae bacterium]
MKKYLYCSLFIIHCCISCDSGDIYPEEKKIEEMNLRVNADFQFENPDAFPQNYRIVWGAFIGTSPYPLSYEAVEKPAVGARFIAPLYAPPKGAEYMALALVEKNENKSIYTFKKFPLDNSATEMNIKDTVDLAPFARVQAQIFTPQCTRCHGDGGLSAGLNLTDGNAYANLVGVPSKADNSPKNRITKFSLQNSFLLDVLTTRPETVATNHTTLTTLDADDDVNLIRAWIMSENE